MLVRIKGTDRQFHLERDIAQALMLAPGSLVEEAPPPPPKKIGPPDTKWTVGYRYGNCGPSDQPSIQAYCSTCKLTWTIQGPTATKTGSKFWHCGVGEEIPKHICKTYQKLLKQIEPQQRPEQTGDAARRLYGLLDRTGVNPSGTTGYEPGDPASEE